METLPTGPAISQVAQTLAWLTRPYDLLRRCASELGDAFTIDLGSHGPYVFVSHPDDVRAVFTASPAVAHAGEGNEVLGAVLGPRSLLLLEEDAHLRERKLLLPPFHARHVDAFVGEVADVAESVASSLSPGEEIAVHQVMERISLEVIRRAVFGTKRVAPGIDEALRSFLADPKFNLGLIGQLRTSGEGGDAWASFRAALERIDAAVLDAIASARTNGNDGILGMLVATRDEDGNPLDDAHLRDQVVTLVVTGFETTATALAWALLRVHQHPDLLARLRREIHGVPSFRDARTIASLRLVDAVCRESLRLDPVLPIVARRLHAPLAIRGHVLPAGVTVAPCAYLAHRRDDAFPAPFAFRPERFAEREPTPYEYFPFGGGARRCLGMPFASMEMRVVLATFLAKCELRPIDAENVRAVRRSVTIAPSGGARMSVVSCGENR